MEDQGDVRLKTAHSTRQLNAAHDSNLNPFATKNVTGTTGDIWGEGSQDKKSIMSMGFPEFGGCTVTLRVVEGDKVSVL